MESSSVVAAVCGIRISIPEASIFTFTRPPDAEPVWWEFIVPAWWRLGNQPISSRNRRPKCCKDQVRVNDLSAPLSLDPSRKTRPLNGSTTTGKKRSPTGCRPPAWRTAGSTNGWKPGCTGVWTTRRRPQAWPCRGSSATKASMGSAPATAATRTVEGSPSSKPAAKGTDSSSMASQGRDVSRLMGTTDYTGFKALGCTGDPIVHGGGAAGSGPRATGPRGNRGETGLNLHCAGAFRNGSTPGTQRPHQEALTIAWTERGRGGPPPPFTCLLVRLPWYPAQGPFVFSRCGSGSKGPPFPDPAPLQRSRPPRPPAPRSAA